MTEKRKGDRASIALFATITVAGVEFTRRTTDLSVGGIRVEHQGDAIPIGENVSINFELPDGARTIYLEGTVAHCTEDTLGIEFGRTKKGVRRALENFVEEYAPLS